MPILVALTAAPTVVIAVIGLHNHDPVLQWLGLVIGMGTGAGFTWGLGRIAYQRLEAQGPELVNLFLKGRTNQVEVADKTDDSSQIWKTLPLWKKVLVRFCMALFWLPLFPQGIVALVFKLTGSEVRSWFLPLYLPTEFQLPVILSMIVLGTAMLYVGIWIPRKQR
jgi:ABC-2 type transport system permease protein